MKVLAVFIAALFWLTCIFPKIYHSPPTDGELFCMFCASLPSAGELLTDVALMIGGLVTGFALVEAIARARWRRLTVLSIGLATFFLLCVVSFQFADVLRQTSN